MITDRVVPLHMGEHDVDKLVIIFRFSKTGYVTWVYSQQAYVILSRLLDENTKFAYMKFNKSRVYFTMKTVTGDYILFKCAYA